MNKEEIHKNWWNGDRDKKSCCEGIGIGYEYQKRIEELEKSNKEWQRTCDAKSDTNSQLIEQLADKVEKIADLEKENAELIGKVAFLENALNNAKAQIEKMKRCEICRHHSNLSGCSYHSGCVKDCKANGMKLFELKG